MKPSPRGQKPTPGHHRNMFLVTTLIDGRIRAFVDTGAGLLLMLAVFLDIANELAITTELLPRLWYSLQVNDEYDIF